MLRGTTHCCCWTICWSCLNRSALCALFRQTRQFVGTRPFSCTISAALSGAERDTRDLIARRQAAASLSVVDRHVRSLEWPDEPALPELSRDRFESLYLWIIAEVPLVLAPNGDGESRVRSPPMAVLDHIGERDVFAFARGQVVERIARIVEDRIVADLR